MPEQFNTGPNPLILHCKCLYLSALAQNNLKCMNFTCEQNVYIVKLYKMLELLEFLWKTAKPKINEVKSQQM